MTVAQTPKYSLRSVLSGDDVPELDAQAWQRAFSQARWVEMFQAVEWIGRLDVYFLLFSLIRSDAGFALFGPAIATSCLQ